MSGVARVKGLKTRLDLSTLLLKVEGSVYLISLLAYCLGHRRADVQSSWQEKCDC